jgi:hypothetical protein
MVLNLIGQALGGVIGLFGDWGKGKQEAVNARISGMERSWTDEVIVVTIFSPLWVGWFSEAKAQAWLAMVDGMPEWYTAMLFAVISAVFGLGKLNGRRK